MIPRIAFLGTGLMGTPMAMRLLGAGYPVTVWNRSAHKTQALVSAGARGAASCAEAVSDAQIVCMCLTDGRAIEDVLFGERGAADALPASSTLIDFSTIGPERTRALAGVLAGIDPTITWVDAPVSGGVTGAERGELVVLCGGREDAVDRVRPLLSVLAKRICRLGPLGSGQAAKMCNQIIVATNILAIAEALALGHAQGLDVTMLPEALQGGWADSLPLQIIGGRMASGTTEPPLAAIGTYVKDLALVNESAAARSGIAEFVERVFRSAAAAGLGGADVTMLLRYLETHDFARGLSGSEAADDETQAK